MSLRLILALMDCLVLTPEVLSKLAIPKRLFAPFRSQLFSRHNNAKHHQTTTSQRTCVNTAITTDHTKHISIHTHNVTPSQQISNIINYHYHYRPTIGSETHYLINLLEIVAQTKTLDAFISFIAGLAS